MHDPVDNVSPAIPPFLAKLGKLVDDPDTDELICWDRTGQSFIILDTIQFTKELLPKYYKHNNLASFIRQLNMYGFRKVSSLDSGNLDSRKNAMQFSHTFFMRGHPYLMENIQRKNPQRNVPVAATLVTDGIENDSASVQMISQILAEVNEVKRKQSGWDQKMVAMKRENESLWRELAIFRQKHLKQEQIINRLIQFIVTMVRPTARGNHVPLRRRYQLMLDESKQPSSSSGPTIRELDPVEQFLSETGASYKTQRVKPSQSNSAERLNQLIDDDLPMEYIEPTSDSPYVVLSPEENNPDSGAPSWLNLGESDTEDAAMTPISPFEITPVPVNNAKPSTFKSPSVIKTNVTNRAKSSVSNQQRKLPVITITAPYRKISPGSASTYMRNIAGKTVTPGSTASIGQQLSSSQANNLILPETQKTRKQKVPKRALRKQKQKEINESTVATTDDGSAIDDSILKEAIDLITGDQKRNSAVEDNVIGNEIADNVGEDNLGLDEGNMAVVRPSTSSYGEDLFRDLGSHVDQVQGDIDILKELLKGDNYNLDANTLLELFNDDPLNLIMPSSDNRGDKQDGEGQELMTYNAPNLLDMADMYVGTPAMDGSRATSPQPPPSPTPSGLQTPTFVPSSPYFPPPTKKRRK